jgi:hypothetical protein
MNGFRAWIELHKRNLAECRCNFGNVSLCGYLSRFFQPAFSLCKQLSSLRRFWRALSPAEEIPFPAAD